MEFKIYTLAEIRAISISDLREFAKEIGVRAPTMYTKEQLENAVYDRLQQIDSQRKIPSELLPPKSRAGIINKVLIPDEERSKYGPFKKQPKGETMKKFVGWFRPYDNGDGIVSRKLLPRTDDLFISQNFVEGAKLNMGDRICGDYVDGEDGRPAMVAHISTVNGRQIVERRAVDIFYADRKKPEKALLLWSDDFSLRSLALAVALKYGSRILLSHGSDCSLTELNLSLAKALKDRGMQVIALFLGVLPEYEKEIDALGATACTFDVGEKYVLHSLEMLVEAAYRAVEEGGDIAVIIDNLDAVADPDLIRRALGCACAIERGSITVFASANEDIMDARSYKTAESVSGELVRFVGRRGRVCVDFKHSVSKGEDADWGLLERLAEIEGEAVDAIVRNCATREDAEKVLL